MSKSIWFLSLLETSPIIFRQGVYIYNLRCFDNWIIPPNAPELCKSIKSDSHSVMLANDHKISLNVCYLSINIPDFINLQRVGNDYSVYLMLGGGNPRHRMLNAHMVLRIYFWQLGFYKVLISLEIPPFFNILSRYRVWSAAKFPMPHIKCSIISWLFV